MMHRTSWMAMALVMGSAAGAALAASDLHAPEVRDAPLGHERLARAADAMADANAAVDGAQREADVLPARLQRSAEAALIETDGMADAAAAKVADATRRAGSALDPTGAPGLDPADPRRIADAARAAAIDAVEDARAGRTLSEARRAVGDAGAGVEGAADDVLARAGRHAGEAVAEPSLRGPGDVASPGLA